MENLKNVLQLIWTHDLAGAERVAWMLGRSASMEGHRVHSCALSSSSSAAAKVWKAAGMETHTLTKRSGFDWTLSGRLRKLCEEQRIQVLHTHNAVGSIYGASVAQKLGIHHIHTEHSNPASTRHLLRWLHRRALRNSEIVADSKKVGFTLSRREGIEAARIKLIYNGVAQSEFLHSKKQARMSLGILDEWVVVGTVGNLRAVKNHAGLIEALAPTLKVKPEVHLVILGEGIERPALERLIALQGLEGKVHLKGARPDARDLLSAFDLFVLPSKSEGLPLSLLEAMGAGLPCVGTAVGGIPEVIDEGRTGLLIPSGSSEALSRAIQWLLDHRSEAEQIGLQAKQKVHERFSEGAMTSDYLRLYGA